MNAARAGRGVAGLAARRSGLSTPSQAVHRQVSQSTVTPLPPPKKPTPPPPVAQETLNPLPTGGGGAAPAGGVPPKTKSNNLLIGTVLVGAAAASYYVTIHKMKDQDFLGDAEKEAEEEAQVNLHKSGLKISSKVVPEKVEKVINRAADVVAKAAGKVEDKVEEVSGDVKDAASEVSSKASDAAKEIKGEAKSAAAAVEAALTGEEVPKKKGWRKYIIFGPRREG